jgi:hypothetical protein
LTIARAVETRNVTWDSMHISVLLTVTKQATVRITMIAARIATILRRDKFLILGIDWHEPVG